MKESEPLYIRVSSNDITLVRMDGQQPHVYRHKLNRRVSFKLNLREAITALPKLIGAEAEVAEVYLTEPVSLVPLTEFSEAEAANIAKSSFREVQRSRVMFDPLPALHTVLVYQTQDTLCKTLEEAFPKVNYHNALSPVLMRGPEATMRTHKMQTYVHEDGTDVVLWEGTKMVAVNCFQTRYADDAVFFMLGMVQAMGLQLDELSASVAGNARSRAEVVGALQRFIPDCRETKIGDDDLPYSLACVLMFRPRR